MGVLGGYLQSQSALGSLLGPFGPNPGCSKHRWVEGSGWGTRLGSVPSGAGDGARLLSLAWWYPAGLAQVASTMAEERWEHSARVLHCARLCRPHLAALQGGGSALYANGIFVKHRCISWINSSLAAAFGEQFSIFLTSYLIFLFSKPFLIPSSFLRLWERSGLDLQCVGWPLSSCLTDDCFE